MKPEFHDLPNGTRLAVARNDHLHSTVVMAGVKVGSRNEPEGMHGAAHFVEHVLFKGTERRPSSKEISGLIESRGGHSNAWTDKEMTAFHVLMSRHDGRIAVDVVHDMMENALFRSSDVEKERSVICEETSMRDNDPDSCVWELSEEVKYAGTGLARRVIGDGEISFSAKSLRKFFKDHYVPSRTLVVLAGAVDDRLVAMATSKFGGMEATPFEGVDEVPSPPFVHVYPRKPVEHSFKEGNTDRLHVVIRFPGIPGSHPDAYTLSLLSMALGGYSSARLFQSVRETKGLCYDIGSGVHGYSDVGSLYISTSIDRPKLAATLRAILKEVADVRKHGVKADELKDAKTHWRGAATLELDDPMSVSTDIVRKIFTNGRYEGREEEIEKLMKIRTSDVADVAKRYLVESRMHISIVGPKAARKEVTETFVGL